MKKQQIITKVTDIITDIVCVIAGAAFGLCITLYFLGAL